MVDRKKIQGFEDLVVWQESQNLAVQVYEITKQFPREEVFGITSQIKRAVSSVSANIAEGFGRPTLKDKLQFYTIAYGSVLETKKCLHRSPRLVYMAEVHLDALLDTTVSCQKLFNGLT